MNATIAGISCKTARDLISRNKYLDAVYAHLDTCIGGCPKFDEDHRKGLEPDSEDYNKYPVSVPKTS